MSVFSSFLRLNLARIVAPTLLMAALTGCGATDPLADFQPEISNVADNFSLQAVGVTNTSATVSYTWANSGTTATINHSTTTQSGTALVVIKDAAGTTVYSKALSPSLNEATTVGVTGNWTIQLTLANYSGTINFVIQKG